MPISSDLLKASIRQIAELGFVSMAPEALVEEVVLMAKSWPSEDDFGHAVASTVRALTQLHKGAVVGSPLKDLLDGWYSYHFQLRRSQGVPADLRIVYRKDSNLLEVAGFGHRYRPVNLYHRIVVGES